jgi:hypothetical protein
MERLPVELIREIFRMEPTKRFHLERVHHQMKTQKMWYEMKYSSRLFKFQKYIGLLGMKQFPILFHRVYYHYKPSTEEMYHYMTENIYESIVQEHCRNQRILGYRPSLPFTVWHLLDAIDAILGL